ncbi:MAG: N-acetylmuramoyl-L-alanine amidase [Lachnospiraceae bacterium]|nr:N-acetylmuramoyl-L-alanine amidase [Lachnospiraceae bacterium]
MAYTNSSMVAYTKLSPNHSGQRTHSIDRITPHCVVGQLSAESICGCFTSPSRQASCNYGIGTDGKVSLCVEEKNRSWCSSSNANDQRAVTIECASDKTEPYAMNSKVYDSLIKLCTDICKRNGKKKLLWLGDRNKVLNYTPKSDEMVLTVHRWFANKSCPGGWLYARLGDLAAKVTAALGSPSEPKPASNKKQLYRVRKTWTDSKSQKGAFSVLANAKKCVDSNKGYSVFDENGKKVYPADAPGTKKSIDAIAREVIRGDWGNGDERKQKLTAAGYNYSAVQKKVNELLK